MRLSLLLLPLCACFERQYDCDNSTHASVSVRLRSSDAQAIEEPWVRYTPEGADEPTACDLTVGTWLCGWDVAGEILIEAGGLCYGSVSQTVTVEQAECHVINQDLQLLLDPVDCTADENPAVYVTVMGEGSVTIDEPTVGYAPADQDWTDHEP